MRGLKRRRDFLLIAGFAVVLSFGGCSTQEKDANIDEEKKDGLYSCFGEETVTINFEDLKYNVDEKMAEDVAKVKFIEEPMGRGKHLPWNRIKAKAYPVYSYDGVRKYYICNIYYGLGDMPSHDEMMRNIKKGYEASKEYDRMLREGKTREEIPDSIKKDMGLGSGVDLLSGEEVYDSMVIPASTSVPIGGGERGGIHKFFEDYYKVIDYVEAVYKLEDVNIDGYIWEGLYGYFKLESHGVYYYYPSASIRIAGELRSEEEIKESTKGNNEREYFKDALEISSKSWRRWIEKAKRYNAGEPVEY